jgi:hypothetical protein
VKRSVTVSLSAFAREALVAAKMNGAETATSVVRAIRVYLNDRGSSESGWLYPPPLRDKQRSGGTTDLRLSIEGELWERLEAEAASQGVTPQQLLDHAVLYLAAEVDAGRITQRILEDLEEE